MADQVHVTLIANAGLLLQYGGVTLMLDGIYGRKGHPFSNLKPEIWDRMLRGEPPFEKIDYLLFSHAHPDHFSPEMTMEFLRHRTVKGVFLPDSHSVVESGLAEYLRESRTPCVMLSSQTDHASYQIEPRISVQAFSTLHLDKKFQNVHHFCYLLTFGEKKILFTADVDYTHETFDAIRTVPLRAVFVNPLFFGVLRRRVLHQPRAEVAYHGIVGHFGQRHIRRIYAIGKVLHSAGRGAAGEHGGAHNEGDQLYQSFLHSKNILRIAVICILNGLPSCKVAC